MPCVSLEPRAWDRVPTAQEPREERVRGHTAPFLWPRSGRGQSGLHPRAEPAGAFPQADPTGGSPGQLWDNEPPSLASRHRAAPCLPTLRSRPLPSPVSGPYLRDPSPHPPSPLHRPPPSRGPSVLFTSQLQQEPLPSLPSDCRLLPPPARVFSSLQGPHPLQGFRTLLPSRSGCPLAPHPFLFKYPTLTPQGSGLSTYRTSLPQPLQGFFQPPLARWTPSSPVGYPPQPSCSASSESRVSPLSTPPFPHPH